MSMDRRQKKTREAIFRAFTELLKHDRCAKRLHCQDILSVDLVDNIAVLYAAGHRGRIDDHIRYIDPFRQILILRGRLVNVDAADAEIRNRRPVGKLLNHILDIRNRQRADRTSRAV